MKIIYAGNPAYVIDLFAKERCVYKLAPSQEMRHIHIENKDYGKAVVSPEQFKQALERQN